MVATSAVNKFGDEDQSEKSGISDSTASSSLDKSATEAIVTIHLAIEGDSTKLPKVISRTDLLLALQKIAADSVVEDCLLSAEVLWAPEEDYETLTRTDIYADYPDLVPLY